MNKAGIPLQAYQDQGQQSLSAQQLHQKSHEELSGDLIRLQSDYEALQTEHNSVNKSNHSLQTQIEEVSSRIRLKEEDILLMDNKIVQYRTKNPAELKFELDSLIRKEADLKNRIRALENNPFYKGQGNQADVIVKVEESSQMIIDLRAQLEAETSKTDKLEGDLKLLKDDFHSKTNEKGAVKENLIKARTLYEASLRRQANMIGGGLGSEPYARRTDDAQHGADQLDSLQRLQEDDEFLRTLGMVKWSGEDPAWLKLDFLEKIKRVDPNDPNDIRKEFVRLTEKKIDLSRKLDQTQAILKTQIEMEKKRLVQHQLETKSKEHELLRCEEKIKDLKDLIDRVAAATRKVSFAKNQRTGQDVYYNDGVSVFSENNSDVFHIGTSENLFDIYVGKAAFQRLSLRDTFFTLNVDEREVDNLCSVVSVDFFNHPTVGSDMCKGLKPQYEFKATLAFEANRLFFDYCKTSQLYFEVYHQSQSPSVKNKLVRLGRAALDLNELLEKNMEDGREDYIGVVNTNLTILDDKNMMIGQLLNVRVRTRFPIFNDLAQYNKIAGENVEADRTDKYHFDLKYLDKERLLHIDVIQATGLSQTAMSYVSFKLLNFEDCITASKSGSMPRFDFKKKVKLRYSEEIRRQLKNGKLEFAVFDDNVPVGQELTKTMEGKYRLNDLIGTCSASLAPLMHDRPIVTRLHVRDFESKIKGSLLVRIYWDDCNLEGGALFSNLDRTWEDSISVRICKGFKEKGLSVKSAFNLTDLDDSKQIDKDEFYKIVCDILKIGLTPEEKHEYWQRVSSRNTLTFNRFLKYYAPFLNKEMLGFEVPESKTGPDGLSLIPEGAESALDSKGIDKIDARLAMIIDKLSRGLQEYQTKNKKQTLEMFDLFDKDGSKKISRGEFIDAVESVFQITWVSVRDLEYIFNYLNKNDTDAELDLVEFFKVMKFDLKKFAEEKQQREMEKRSSSDLLDKNQVLFEFIDSVKKWLRENDKSVYDLFLKIDKNGTKKLSRAELKQSCYDLFGLKNFTDKKMEVVMMELDEDESKTIDVQEFIDLLNLYDEFKLLSNKQNLKEIRESPILRNIYSYLNLREIESEDLMLEMDKNKDGSIQIMELASFLKKMKSTCTDEDIESFLYFFDKDGDREISIEELQTAVRTFQRAQEQERQIPELVKAQLIKKLIPIVEGHAEKLREHFKTYEIQGKPGWVTVSDFKTILKATKLFQDEEVELIANPILLIKTRFGKIQYEGFINISKTYKEYAQMKKSGVFMLRGKQLTDKIFKIMKKVAIRQNLEALDIFNCLDISEDGYITLKELRKVFTDMGLDLSEDQYEDLVRELDKKGDRRSGGNEDGKISFGEFCRHYSQVTLEELKK